MLKNWQNIQVSDYITIQNGFAFKSENFIHNGIPLVKIASIHNNKVIIDENESYANIGLDKKFKVNFNDLVIAMSGATTGKIGIYKYRDFAYLNQRVCKIQSKNENKIINRYLPHLFNSDNFKYQMKECLAAGAQPNLSPTQIGNMQFMVPNSTKEQEAISESLDDLDLLIENLENLIEKKKLIINQVTTHQKPQEDCRSILLRICRGLEFCHFYLLVLVGQSQFKSIQ